MGVTQKQTPDQYDSSTDGSNEMTEAEVSAVEQVSPDVEQKVRGNEPVLCPPYCYAGVVAGGFAKGYLATKSAGSSAQMSSADSSAAQNKDGLKDAPVDELIEARDHIE